MEVSLEVASASVSESNGSIEVCVAVVSGQLSRDLELNLFTQSGTATCKYSLHCDVRIIVFNSEGYTCVDGCCIDAITSQLFTVSLVENY